MSEKFPSQPGEMSQECKVSVPLGKVDMKRCVRILPSLKGGLLKSTPRCTQLCAPADSDIQPGMIR